MPAPAFERDFLAPRGQPKWSNPFAEHRKVEAANSDPREGVGFLRGALGAAKRIALAQPLMITGAQAKTGRPQAMPAARHTVGNLRAGSDDSISRFTMCVAVPSRKRLRSFVLRTCSEPGSALGS